MKVKRKKKNPPLCSHPKIVSINMKYVKSFLWIWTWYLYQHCTHFMLTFMLINMIAIALWMSLRSHLRCHFFGEMSPDNPVTILTQYSILILCMAFPMNNFGILLTCLFIVSLFLYPSWGRILGCLFHC